MPELNIHKVDLENDATSDEEQNIFDVTVILI